MIIVPISFINTKVVVPVGGSGLALVGGGLDTSSYNYSSAINYINMSSASNATFFGSLSLARQSCSACSNSTTGFFAGGTNGTYQKVIDSVTISTTGSSTLWGNLSVSKMQMSSASNETIGIFFGGNTGSDTSAIESLSLSSASNSVSFGNLSYTIGASIGSACSDKTRAIFFSSSSLKTISYVTISTTGSSASFGSLLASRNTAAACSSGTVGIIGCGNGAAITNTVESVTISTLGNSTSFGSLTAARYGVGGASNKTVGMFFGGNGSYSKVIDTISFSGASSSAFGNLYTGLLYTTACSDSHGGL